MTPSTQRKKYAELIYAAGSSDSGYPSCGGEAASGSNWKGAQGGF